MFRVKKDDQIVVLSGKDRGKKGKVLAVLPQDGTLTVEGVHMVKRHVRRSQQSPQGGVVSMERPFALDRVMPVCPRCNRGVRVGSKKLADGTKVRICRRCGEAF